MQLLVVNDKKEKQEAKREVSEVFDRAAAKNVRKECKARCNELTLR